MTKKEKEIKLSATQIWVIKMMLDGWELGHSKGYTPHTWIQDGGVGKGGNTHTVSVLTFNKLRSLNIIRISKESYPTDKYNLTELGKSIKL